MKKECMRVILVALHVDAFRMPRSPVLS
jgi:hypothetical protein